MTRASAIRGFTLLETLAALVLTAVLTTALFAWNNALASLAGEETSRTDWAVGAQRLADAIATDLRSGDFDAALQRRSPRVQTGEGAIRIRSRRPGVGHAEVVYRFDPNRSAVTVSINGSEAVEALGRVGAFAAERIENRGRNTAFVRVRIVHTDVRRVVVSEVPL